MLSPELFWATEIHHPKYCVFRKNVIQYWCNKEEVLNMIKYWVVESESLVCGGDISSKKEYLFETEEQANEFYLKRKDRDNFKYGISREKFKEPKEKYLKFDNDYVRCKIETYKYQCGKYVLSDISEPRYETETEAKEKLRETIQWELQFSNKGKKVAYIEGKKYMEKETE